MAFDTYYPSSPWDGITTNQRNWYDPLLREIFVRDSVYARFVSTQFALAGAGSPVTTQMTINSLIPAHGNNDSISLREMWMPSSYMDSFARNLTFERYGGKVGLHKYDNMVTYWKQNGVQGLRRIVDNNLGGMMVQVMNKLARNAFLTAPYKLYADGAATGFNGIGSGDKLTTEIIDSVRLGFADRGVPFTLTPSGNDYQTIQPICITSPGVLHDLMNEQGDDAANKFISVMRYADPRRIIKGEVGSYRNVRFIEEPAATLWNCGTIIAQSKLAAPVNAGDGASPDAVDGVRIVGQPAATKYVTVASSSGFAVNDMVTIHLDRTADFGVTNGVDYRDGHAVVRRIEKIDGNNLSFDYPIMEDFVVDLGSSTYGYVTSGKHIHTSTFIGGMDGVVLGVGQAPQLYTPRPVDDFDAMYRFSWDAYMKYQLFEPQVFEVVISAGTNRTKGRLISA